MTVDQFLNKRGCPRFQDPFGRAEEREPEPRTPSFTELMSMDEKKAEAVVSAIMDRLDPTRIYDILEALETRGAGREDARQRALYLLETEVKAIAGQQGVEVRA